MYRIEYATAVLRDIKKLSRNQRIFERINSRLKILSVNPFYPVLGTHQVDIPSLGKVWSSKVTGDLRLIWDFDQDQKLTILAIRLQGHDNVYK